jgi:hypothetical protein
MNTISTLCPILDELWADCATAKTIVEHAASHGCNPSQAEFYLGFFELNVARTSADATAALDRCERAAQAVPDLRFVLVEQILTAFADDPVSGEQRSLVLERQRELRTRWTTLPCRPHASLPR